LDVQRPKGGGGGDNGIKKQFGLLETIFKQISSSLTHLTIKKEIRNA
jgi:hypothetical protein